MHDWDFFSFCCRRCGCTDTQVVDNVVPKECPATDNVVGITHLRYRAIWEPILKPIFEKLK